MPARRVGGLILVEEPNRPVVRGTAVVYVRVSSADQRSDVDQQVARITTWAGEQGIPVGRVVSEVGPALNGHRWTFLGLLGDPQVASIVVERCGRFAWFGGEYLDAALAASGRRLLVVDPAGVDDDPAGDITDILTSMYARLYGRLYGRCGAVTRGRRAVEAVVGAAG
ncbi:putative site-specific integrase-resolvase [Frankia sp. QA3]|nr:putative site-specific integrase-resolvase [Frankia sp. QA3]